MQRYLSIPNREAHEGLRIKWAQVPQKLDYRIRISVAWLLGVQAPAGYWDARGPWLTGAVIKALITAKSKVPELQEQIDSAVKRGLDWLVSDDIMQKLPHGGVAWDPNLGTWDTAVILRAFLCAKYPDYAIINGIKNWLIDQVGRTYFGSTTVPFGESYPAQTLLALEEAGETIYSKGVGQIFRDKQLEDGSWGDHFNTSEVLQYLTRHRDENNESIKSSVVYIQKTQAPNGTWSSLTWPTAVTLMAYLESADNPYSFVTIKALEYLSGQQHVNGSWFHLLADTTFAIESLVMAVNKLDFARFDFVTGSDFKMSSISVIPEEKSNTRNTRGHREYTIKINSQYFNAFRIAMIIVAISLGYTIIMPLINGWGTLSLAQKIDLVVKLVGAILASIISVFMPLIIKRFGKNS